MTGKIRRFVREAGLVITFFVASSFLTFAYVILTQAYLALANWPPIAERLVSLR